uniref:Glutamine-dependent NAD(+) synthetase n=1 Tax=Alexandrium monilatum TaxID=311494 RepID=A0A7S4T6Z9_9DINO|mmetsp:Transcript_11409/g.34417  ORF Transcript_11409/g.34417 Transcript_11409/m.34417 type:complete len:753 (+) Transcript_11409:121-2379(+)
MAALAKVATCNLNQWAMDFVNNRTRIIESIREAKAHGCKFRTGPELEITGYGCEDYFLEHDTFLHAWESLAELLKSGVTDGILCDIGMPVMHRNVSYNCRVVCLDGKILGIRPKFYLANDGNYREMRYFTPWFIDPAAGGFGEVEEYFLPTRVQAVTGQVKVPIGIFAVSTLDTAVSFETCEELFTPKSPHIQLSLDGVEIIANGSGSHHRLRKLDKRIDLVKGATSKAGGVYLYANMKGCDGGRLWFDGCAMVWVNGSLVAQGSQFGPLDEVEVVVATVNLSDVRSFRSNFIARSFQASSAPTVHRIEVPFRLTDADPLSLTPSQPRAPKLHDPMEEIAYGPSAWLWDYLRRSGQRGYFLPLSGGADSSSTATLVAIMCQRVVEELKSGSERSKKQVLADIRRITKRPQYTPSDWKDLCGKIFVTCYMASKYSGDETRGRAKQLAQEIGAIHTSIYIDSITDALQGTFKNLEFHTDKLTKAQLKTDPQMDGTWMENIALQNIQARSRMVMAYFMAQLMPWATDGDETTAGGALLVLGSANVDEALRGYYTKYDCSAADINPIGGVNKTDLKSFLEWAGREKGIAVLQRVADAKPSAELTGAEGAQLDEEDMGMSYAELGDLGRCRKIEHGGPLSTFLRLRTLWNDGRRITPSKRARGDNAPVTFDQQVAQKVKDFFFYNAINRHKMTTLTPSYHAEDYSPDDNRFDLRPFLQPASFEAQFAAIDAVVAAAASSSGAANGEAPAAKRARAEA